MLKIDELRNAATRYAGIVTLAKAQGRTAFLCHSHQDGDLAQGLQTVLLEQGCHVYLDWQDTSMPPVPDRNTAARIQKKIRESDYFMFLATANSTASRWCPWEIGYADSVKGTANIIVVPTSDRGGVWHGNEYLQLYRRIDNPSQGGLAVFNPDNTGIFVKSL